MKIEKLKGVVVEVQRLGVLFLTPLQEPEAILPPLRTRTRTDSTSSLDLFNEVWKKVKDVLGTEAVTTDSG